MKLFLFAGVLAFAGASARAADSPTSPAPPPPYERSVPLPKVVAGPMEEITITSSRLPRIVRDFVDVATMPSPIGQVSRWKVRVCPRTTGMAPAFTSFVTRRVREIGRDVGVPVNDSETCAPNLQIIFTERPQEMLDVIRVKLPELLGYHYAPQAKELAAVEHPVQGWYATGSRDRRGQLIFDNPYGMAMTTVEGSRIRTGLRSEFVAVTVVIDLVRVENQEIGAIADQAALLAFSQARAFERCRDVPSVANMFLACDAELIATGLTRYDRAYLKALYAITDRDTPGNHLKGDIAFLMRSYLREEE
ncbi:MAG: hypothetical protein AB7E79_15720 [Rhodospirillaceae bacterium]